MARDEKRRQKALLKKRRGDNERKKKSNALNIFCLDSYSYKAGLIKRAKQFPIYECLINEDWQDKGLAHILLSRKQLNNELIIGVFLVDIYCLGLKNTFCNANISLEEYERLKFRISQESSLVTCDPILANRIIYGAIEYARKLGFEPQKDFRLSQFTLDESSDANLSYDVEFGKDGKPLYIAGPNDNVDHVIKQLSKNVGDGNFHYLLPVEL
ncbi:MAG: hypothetical protein Q8P40_04045 [Nitrospirota bacterium]|nr:hypothetical protein [Nitrospirota bacterium]